MTAPQNKKKSVKPPDVTMDQSKVTPTKGLSKKEQTKKVKTIIEAKENLTEEEFQERVHLELIDHPLPTAGDSSPASPLPTTAPQEMGVDPAIAGGDKSVVLLRGTDRVCQHCNVVDCGGSESCLIIWSREQGHRNARAEDAICSDVLFQRFRAYLKLNWSPTAVSIQIGNLATASPTSMVHPDLWDFARGSINLPQLIYKHMMTMEFLLRVWQSLKIALGHHLPNREWAAGIATTLASCEVIMDLPTIKQALEDAIAGGEKQEK